LVPGIWYWRGVATLCMLGFCDWDWVWVTQGSPMRDAREIQGSISRSSFVCNKDVKKAGGVGRSPTGSLILPLIERPNPTPIWDDWDATGGEVAITRLAVF